MRWLLVVLFATSCVRSNSHSCADGRLCPDFDVCDDAHQGCVRPEQVTACEGKADLASCSYQDVADGVCDRGVCFPAGCGNQIVETQEQCDDGNTAGGDGCSADCKSTEKCGNGVLDPSFGETCDDGNVNSHDGCASVCLPEAASWQQAVATVPAARQGAAIAFDPKRGKLVLFGGLWNTFTNDTWEWDAQTGWRQRHPFHTPFARWNATMVYDAARGVTVMFGGHLGDTSMAPLADTWIWDGLDWKDVTPLISPPPRFEAVMVYDSQRHDTVLFGGGINAGDLNDTWIWDGAKWRNAAPATSPPAARFAQAAFDPKRGEVVLVGGTSGNGTWTWNGTNWTDVTPTTSPPTSTAIFGVLLYDAIGGGLILAGCNTTETWRWLDGRWSQLTPATALTPSRQACGGASDPANRRAYVFGGQPLTSATLNDLWAWDGSTWNSLAEPTTLASPPLPRRDGALAYDAERREVVLFGSDQSNYDDTWIWNGAMWVQRMPAHHPSARNTLGLVDDFADGGVLAFGGKDSSTGTPLDETWLWNGTDWRQLTPPTSPSPRSGFGIAYDAARHHVIVFGGIDAVGGLLDETWTWDGITWSHQMPASSPSPRARPRMAYDAARDRVVLFGGFDGDFSGETWEWDGTTWTKATPTVSPSPRTGGVMAYDANRRHVLLFGGTIMNSNSTNDTWEWDGTNWHLLTPNVIVPARSRAAIAYDAARGEVVLFGGKNVTNSDDYNDTWLHRFDGGQVDERCDRGFDADHDGAIGCADADCWSVCSPTCPPGTMCPASEPHCGDGTCSSLESCRSCPADCGSCTPVCGDFLCDPGETSCPGDCAP